MGANAVEAKAAAATKGALLVNNSGEVTTLAAADFMGLKAVAHATKTANNRVFIVDCIVCLVGRVTTTREEKHNQGESCTGYCSIVCLGVTVEERERSR